MMMAVPVSYRVEGKNESCLAGRKLALSSDAGVLEEVGGDELVVVGGLGVLEDVGEELEVGGSQVVGDLLHTGLGHKTTDEGRGETHT